MRFGNFSVTFYINLDSLNKKKNDPTDIRVSSPKQPRFKMLPCKTDYPFNSETNYVDSGRSSTVDNRFGGQARPDNSLARKFRNLRCEVRCCIREGVI